MQNLIFSVAQYGCETQFLTLREECRQRVLENRVLRKILGPKTQAVTRDWRKLHNEKALSFVALTNYYSGDEIKDDEIGGGGRGWTCHT
jgi:hypothetical protein